MLRAAFVRTVGERDRVYATRSDGSEVSWVFPTYGDGLPHDLVHLVVERAFGLARGFWGRVDTGANPGRIADEANRRGGRDKYAAFGPDRSELLLAEALANAGWALGDDDAAIRERIVAACREMALEPPRLEEAAMRETRRLLAELGARWRSLVPKGSLELTFPA